MDSRKQKTQAELDEGSQASGDRPADYGSRPTQKTIAAITGLAITTVSKALADDPKIALATKDRVQDVAREIGYVPDRAAQRLRTGRTNVIALVLDPHSEIIGFSDQIISGVADALLDTPFHLVLMRHGLGERPMDPIRRIVRNRLADGVILARTTAQDERVSFLIEHDFPFVTHGRTEIGRHLWVDYDNEAFAALAVERLAAQGRRKLVLIAPSSDFMFGKHMRAGFERACAEHRISGAIPGSIGLHSDPIAIREGAFKLMNQADPPDGWICPGEIAAMAVNAASYDMGHVLGEDLDIVAKKTSSAVDLLRPSVSFISEDLRGAGVELAELLKGRINRIPHAVDGKLIAPEAMPTSA